MFSDARTVAQIVAPAYVSDVSFCHTLIHPGSYVIPPTTVSLLSLLSRPPASTATKNPSARVAHRPPSVTEGACSLLCQDIKSQQACGQLDPIACRCITHLKFWSITAPSCAFQSTISASCFAPPPDLSLTASLFESLYSDSEVASMPRVSTSAVAQELRNGEHILLIFSFCSRSHGSEGFQQVRLLVQARRPSLNLTSYRTTDFLLIYYIIVALLCLRANGPLPRGRRYGSSARPETLELHGYARAVDLQQTTVDRGIQWGNARAGTRRPRRTIRSVSSTHGTSYSIASRRLSASSALLPSSSERTLTAIWLARVHIFILRWRALQLYGRRPTFTCYTFLVSSLVGSRADRPSMLWIWCAGVTRALAKALETISET